MRRNSFAFFRSPFSLSSLPPTPQRRGEPKVDSQLLSFPFSFYSHLCLIHLLLAPDPPEQLLPVAVMARQTHTAARRGRRPLPHAVSPLPPPQVNLVDTDLLLGVDDVVLFRS